MKLLVCLSILSLVGCSPRAARMPVKFGSSAAALQPIESPDKEHVLHLSVNQSQADPTRYLCVKIDVQNQSGQITHTIQTPASDGMKWAVGWLNDSTVVLNSRDIGLRAWKLAATGSVQELSVTREMTEFGEKVFSKKYRSP